jgi:hypothetical protein
MPSPLEIEFVWQECSETMWWVIFRSPDKDLLKIVYETLVTSLKAEGWTHALAGFGPVPDEEFGMEAEGDPYESKEGWWREGVMATKGGLR